MDLTHQLRLTDNLLPPDDETGDFQAIHADERLLIANLAEELSRRGTLMIEDVEEILA